MPLQKRWNSPTHPWNLFSELNRPKSKHFALSISDLEVRSKAEILDSKTLTRRITWKYSFYKPDFWTAFTRLRSVLQRPITVVKFTIVNQVMSDKNDSK